MEPVRGPAFDAPAFAEHVVFVDPSDPRYCWSSTVPAEARSGWWMFFGGVASMWDVFGDMPVDLHLPSEWQALRDDFDRVAADFHRCVLRGPHPPEQGSLFETVDS
ncbi:MAG: hypothetical protein LC808_19330 [Actinobacteria bacterium]|nr:hypothetical protein [Actinomycetota bacterium]